MKQVNTAKKKGKDLSAEAIPAILHEHAGDLRKHSIRGGQKRRSDIELLVEFDTSSFGENFRGCFDTYMDLTFLLEKIFHNKVDLLTSEMISPYVRPYV